MAYKDAHSDINLMLMGKSGHGKSSTGNSILGRKEFVALGGGTSVTKEQQNGYTQVEGRTIKVVDIPGVCDTDCTTDEAAINLVVTAITAGLRQFREGFHALLLVLSFAVRITPEEQKAIEALKLILGENVLRDHTIIVFTHGDSFKDNFEDQDIDFKTWCRQQVHYKDLFDECNWRCVLFDNSRSCTRDEKHSQVIELIAKVDSLKNMHTNFTINKLVAAEKTREKVKRVSFLLERYSREIGLIKDALHKIMCFPSQDRLEKIKKLKLQASKLIEDLSEEDHEKLTNITSEVKNVSVHIQSLEGMLIQQEQEKVQLKQIVDDMKQRNEREIEEMKLRGIQRQKEMDQLHQRINSEIDRTGQKLDSKAKEETSGFFAKAFNFLKDWGPLILSIGVMIITKKPMPLPLPSKK